MSIGQITGRELRSGFDGDEPFMGDGHGIKKIRRQEREAPEWATDKDVIQKTLLVAFPKLNTDPVQRTRAGRWARIIYLYFQCGCTYSETAEAMGEEPGSVLTILRSIRRVFSGLRADGSGVRKPKQHALSYALNGEGNKDQSGTPQPAIV